MKLSKRLQNFPEYPFARYQRRIKQIEQQSGKKVLSFGMGSPDIRPSEKYIQKYQEFVAQADSHGYPGFGLIPELEKALIDWHKSRFHVELVPSQIAPLLGAKDGVSHINLALLDDGDEVLIPNPGYPAYTGGALLVNAKPVYYDLEQGDQPIDFVKLEKKVTKATKFIWANFPANPSGQTVDLDFLEKLVAFVRDHNLVLVYDNAYSELTFDGYVAPSILQVKGASEVAVELQSYSKTFSFAGFRMGWIAGNQEVIAALMKVKSQLDSGLSRPLQLLGAYSLDNFDQAWYQDTIATYQKRRDVIAGYLKRLGLEFDIPKGSLYIWAKIPDKYDSSEKYSFELLENRQVFFTPGSAFGTNGEGYVRVSICRDIENIDQYLQ